MRPTKIVLIGAASSSFGPAMIRDAVLAPDLAGSELWLVDIDSPRLHVMAAYARRLNEAHGSRLRIHHTTQRTEALPGAEFVIVSVAVKRDELWKLDFSIPIKHGINQVLGENGGPGGLSHALRNIPIVLDIAHDMERLCPHALLMNFSNPESRICLALSRYSSVRFAGLCHGIGMGYSSISKITGIPAGDLQGIAAGLNHFAWFLSIWRKSSGEDVYPLLRQRDSSYDQSFYPLTRYLFRRYGLYPHPSDDHIGEYLGFAAEACGLDGYDFAKADANREQRWQHIVRVTGGDEPVPALTASGEFAIPIIVAAIGNRHDLIEAVNIRNGGLISNLPDWAIVEVPALAGADGLQGVQIGRLPVGIAALLNTQAHVQDLVVEAAVHGSRSLALQALLADPVVQSVPAAEATLDELLKVHAAYLPQFARS